MHVTCFKHDKSGHVRVGPRFHFKSRLRQGVVWLGSGEDCDLGWGMMRIMTLACCGWKLKES